MATKTNKRFRTRSNEISVLKFSVFLLNQVDYDNHPLYKHGKMGRKQSPVRLFTNLSPRDIILPKEEGYRLLHVHSVKFRRVQK